MNADGSVIVAGQTDFKGPVNFILARFRDTGVADTTFAGVSGGVVVTGFQPDVQESANALFVQADGKIVVAGDSRTTNGTGGVDQRVAIARYNPDGSLDNTFGDAAGNSATRTGKTVAVYETHDPAGSIDHAAAVAEDAQGKVIVGGFAGSVSSSTVSDAALGLCAFMPDGRPDTTAGRHRRRSRRSAGSRRSRRWQCRPAAR